MIEWSGSEWSALGLDVASYDSLGLCSSNVNGQTLEMPSQASKADKASTCELLEAEDKGTSAEIFSATLLEGAALARSITAAYNPRLRGEYFLVSA